ncbi:hypothetical protein KPBMHCEF_00183 [Salmonella phage EH3]|nr:hypothetical protein KPBMHCEF_00183 [Salmonella phage EH3]WMM35266.1 hypothetical protein PJFCHJHM_00172 [Salmonella phage EH4]WMT11253.1 hypothetical protein BFINDDAI_00179 [Salmonella phage EH2]WMT11407.1 hypothetical protein BFINDDAO_00179 [Salmonella phage EH5]
MEVATIVIIVLLVVIILGMCVIDNHLARIEGKLRGDK